MAVVALIETAEDLRAIVPWARRLARARSLPLAICAPLLEPGRTNTEIDADPEAFPAELRAALETPPDESDPPTECLVARGGTLLEAALAAIAAGHAQLAVVAHHRAGPKRGPQAEFGAALLERAPCDTLLLRAGPEDPARPPRRVLIPVAGGPHAEAALGWFSDVARTSDIRLTALYVQAEHVEEAEAVGRAHLEQALRHAGLPLEAPWIEPRVVVSDEVEQAIVRVAADGHDLLVVGASNRGRVRSWLFGTVPQRLLSGPGALAIGAMRAAAPLEWRMRQWLRAAIARRVPQLGREERVALYERLQAGSEPGFDFYAMTALSTAIAALGLIQDATAVVIGAMLVAPLMTPMLGAGLALIQGNVVLVRSAARSIGNGFLLALAVGLVFGPLAPLGEPTAELLARGSPNLFDLLVALLSGVAAAYAYGRPNLMGALAGVAIAAALVPPIATAGITLARGEPAIARGATLLFATNLVAIVLGAAAAFWALGVRASSSPGRRRLWVRRTLLGLILAALVLSFPLASSLLGPLLHRDEPLLRAVRETLAATAPGAHLEALERSRKRDGAHVTLR
ncbi:MAG: DUF389 domain-containing protein, partial [Planctomycetota bacterium]